MTVGSYVNTMVGNYRLIDFIGAGGMGEVYRAVRVGSGEVVAVKLLLGAQGADMLQRFRNEARIHAALRHPNIAAMREFIESADAPAIAMEFIDGDTLEMRIRQRGSLSQREALHLFAPIVDAIGFMHQRGVLHRDIKPANVKIARDGSPRLLDFGIAKSAQSPKLTATGAVVGTWHYLSPEQLRTGIAESRSDLWALGVLLYEMVTGRLPFDGGGVAALTERILKANYTPASHTNHALSPAVDRIIARCLTVRLEDRYQAADAILRDIKVITTPPIKRVDVTPREARGVLSRIPIKWPVKWPTGLPAKLPWHFPSLTTMRNRAMAMGASTGISWQQVKPAAAIVGLAAVVGVLAYQITPRANDVGSGGKKRGADTVNVTTFNNGPIPPNVFNYSPTRVTDSQTVSIKTLELQADVWIDGQRVGSTPFSMTRLIGTEVQVVLKRDGYRDFVLKFPVSIGKPEYNIQLERVVHQEFP